MQIICLNIAQSHVGVALLNAIPPEQPASGSLAKQSSSAIVAGEPFLCVNL